MLYIISIVALVLMIGIVGIMILNNDFSIISYSIIFWFIGMVCSFLAGVIIENSKCIDAVEVAKYDRLKMLENIEGNTLDNDYIFSTAVAPDEYLFYYQTGDLDTYNRYTFSSSNVTIIKTEEYTTPIVVKYELYEKCDLNIFERILVFGAKARFCGMKYEIYLPKS